jgi:peptidylprolyl isomerase
MKLRILVTAAAAALIAGFAFAKDNDKKIARPSDYVANAPEEAWRPLDPENMLLIDLPAGLVIIEMRPDFAPQHIEQIKKLVRAGFYNGLTFHRVVEGFVAQGGDPKGDGTGQSDLPDIPGEFSRDAKDVSGFTELGRDRIAARIGFIDGMPVAAQPESLRSFKTDRQVLLWGVHCPGVMSMARSTDPNSANSQFFLMLGEARLDLDKRYTTWGWIVDGAENSRRIVRGEPPPRPTPIIRMRIGSDVAENERPNIEVMRTDSEAFRLYFEAAGAVKGGFIRDICAIKPPRRINGKIEL